MNQATAKIPYSSDAEQAVLGGLMLDNERWDDVLPLVGERDFHLAAHSRIFQAMARLMAVQQPIDLITLHESLEQNGALYRSSSLPNSVRACPHGSLNNNQLLFAWFHRR